MTGAGTGQPAAERLRERLVEQLITAWEAWDHSPSARPAVVAIEMALAALGIEGTCAYRHVAEIRNRRVPGQRRMAVCDAIQIFINEHPCEVPPPANPGPRTLPAPPTPHDLPEAS